MSTDRLEYMLRQLPLAQSVPISSIKLPAFKAPSLEGLTVVMKSPAALTVDEVLQAAEGELFNYATQVERKLHEPVALGDVVCIDMLGYSNGKLVPLAAKFEHFMRLMPDGTLPGVVETIATAKVGDTVLVQFTFPESYSVVALRGQPALFIVTLHSARAVTLPDPQSAAFLKKVGAKTYDAWLKGVEARLEDKKSTELALAIQNRVLDELVKRVDVELPEALIAEEIRRKWAAHEGRGMAERAFKAHEQQEALEGWLKSGEVRAETTRRLKIALVLRSILERDGIRLDPQIGKDLLLTLAAQVGIDKKTVKAELTKSKLLAVMVANLGLHLVTVEHVMSKAKVTFQ
ncbi:MAG: hypothetical protein K1X64_16630 [Myxococcaceae bacterium]|nr:hypothetical protein [Myxococcaceae bacterium]